MTHVSAPGKLMIAGEWAVLAPGNPAIVAAVNKRVHAEVRKSDSFIIELKDFNLNTKGSLEGEEISWDSDDEKLSFAKAVVETMVKYLGKSNPFRLITYGSSDIFIGKNKLGFGSSSAATVAMTAAILYHFEASSSKKELVYKLATIANYKAQGKVGSGFDIAASTYGDVIAYERFDPKWLEIQLQSMTIRDVVIQKWPGFAVRLLGRPDYLFLLVAFSGKSASTVSMVKEMKGFKLNDPDNYARIYSDISSLVQNLEREWKEQDQVKILSLVNKNEELLRELTEHSSVDIETEELRKITEAAKEAGGAGKLSGAGGGDCAIGVCFDPETSEKIQKAWIKDDFELVDIKIDREGVKKEK
jgi:phosphomevalonate kinase